MSFTNLASLISSGAKIKSGVVRKTVKWTPPADENGKKEQIEFDVFVSVEMSAADAEKIYAFREADDSIMARRVSRRIFLGEHGEEKIPFEVANTFNYELLIALTAVINEQDEVLEKLKEKKEAEAIKNGEDPKN